jgi:hypothetical protein
MQDAYRVVNATPALYIIEKYKEKQNIGAFIGSFHFKDPLLVDDINALITLIMLAVAHYSFILQQTGTFWGQSHTFLMGLNLTFLGQTNRYGFPLEHWQK